MGEGGWAPGLGLYQGRGDRSVGCAGYCGVDRTDLSSYRKWFNTHKALLGNTAWKGEHGSTNTHTEKRDGSFSDWSITYYDQPGYLVIFLGFSLLNCTLSSIHMKNFICLALTLLHLTREREREVTFLN